MAQTICENGFIHRPSGEKTDIEVQCRLCGWKHTAYDGNHVEIENEHKLKKCRLRNAEDRTTYG